MSLPIWQFYDPNNSEFSHSAQMQPADSPQLSDTTKPPFMTPKIQRNFKTANLRANY